MKTSTLRRYIKMIVAETLASLPNEESEELEEFSGAGAVAGMTLPLGMSPDNKNDKQKKRHQRKKQTA